ncbi:hypothetical protein ACIBJF_16765 [Streptomyces sp. NPDC050743]|uniref:hypothetical protein n=1 Tax=Streptomyces sp. NPDC050743 TaxID=3365634 RepID=UPI00379D0C5B
MKKARKALVAAISAGILAATVASLGVAATNGDPEWDSVRAGAADSSAVITPASPDDHAWD